MIPHAAGIIDAGVMLALLAIGLWWEHRRFTSNCTCQKRGTLLRPKWRKVDVKDDYDRYDKDGGAA